MEPRILFQFGTEETVIGLLLGLALIIPAMLGMARRPFYGAITVILAVTTIYTYFHANQEFIDAFSGPRSELPLAAIAVRMWLQAVRLFGLATLGGLLATILFQAELLSPHKEEQSMTKDPEYNTNSLEYPPEHRNVYHDHNNCPEGKKIKQEHRESGPGGKLHCKECIKLD